MDTRPSQQPRTVSGTTCSSSGSSPGLESSTSTNFSDFGKKSKNIFTPGAMEASTPEALAQWKPQKQEYLVMLTIAFISLMVALDATILVSVLPTLAVDLHGLAEEAFWAGTSYLLSSTVFMIFITDLSEIFGRQQLVQASLTFFTAGSIICACAGNFPVLLAGRVIKGVGGGGIITLGQVIFADIIPLRQRPKWFSLVLAAWALGNATC
jgi:predicted MFS family arabinose efflux permease